MLLIERQSTDEAKKTYAEAQDRNRELMKKLEDAESKVDQLQDSVQRFFSVNPCLCKHFVEYVEVKCHR